MEIVRVCRVCGQINPSLDSTRCSGCFAFLERSETVPRDVAERRARRFRIPLWRKSYLFLTLALVLGWIAWKAVTMFDVLPLVIPPPGASTDIGAVSGPHTWSQARQNAGSTAFTLDPAPFPEKVKWTFATSKPLVTSPAVVDGRVYLTTDDGRTLALEEKTGRLVWEYRSGWPSSSTPAVTADLVISAVRPGQVVALDRATGRVVWERDLGGPVLSSPIVANGSVFLGSADKNLYALDAATGRQLWSFATDNWITETVAYVDGTVAVVSQGSNLNIVGARTGRRQLIYNTGRSRRIGGGPVIQGKTVYFGSVDGSVWAVDRKAKTYPFGRAILFWKLNFYVWGIIPEPVQKGSIWSTFVGGDLMRTPAVTPNAIYTANRQGKVTALDPATGKKLWASEVASEVTSPPAVAGGTVLVGTLDGKVFGLDGGTGEILWDFKTGGKITASPVVAGDTLYVASHDGTLYALIGR